MSARSYPHVRMDRLFFVVRSLITLVTVLTFKLFIIYLEHRYTQNLIFLALTLLGNILQCIVCACNGGGWVGECKCVCMCVYVPKLNCSTLHVPAFINTLTHARMQASKQKDEEGVNGTKYLR